MFSLNYNFLKNSKGEKGDTFFFVEDGEAIASKVLKIGSPPEIVYQYKPGDYFGELALLRDTPRAANIIAMVINEIYQKLRTFKSLTCQ